VSGCVSSLLPPSIPMIIARGSDTRCCYRPAGRAAYTRTKVSYLIDALHSTNEAKRPDAMRPVREWPTHDFWAITHDSVVTGGIHPQKLPLRPIGSDCGMRTPVRP
jgi:hypothetical protein